MTTGTHNFRFRLYDAVTGGTQIGSTLCSDNLAVTGGRFTISLDFGAAAFTGQERFIEIEVRQDSGLACTDATGYTLLTPRQEFAAAPNATFAQAAATAANASSLNGQLPSFYQNASNLTGTLPDAQLSSSVARLNANQTFTGQLNFTNVGNTFAGNGAGLTSLNGGSINAGTLARSSLSADVQSGVGTVTLDLSLAESVATGSSPLSVAVSGSFAYVLKSGSNTLQVFNISNPAAPTLAGSVATGSQPRSVAVSGSFAYVVNQASGTLQVFKALGVSLGTPLVASSLAGVNGAGLTGVNATQLNGQPASFFTNAANLNAGTIPQAVLPASGWSSPQLGSNSISSTAAYTPVNDTAANIAMRQGVAVVSWSTTAYCSAPTTGFLLRIRAVTGGVATLGPTSTYFFNSGLVHTTISGNAVIPIPSTGITTFSLEILRASGTGEYQTDFNDSFTASIINLGQ